jgi:hypothetical protein
MAATEQENDSSKSARTELLSTLQVRVDQRAHGSGAIGKVDVGGLDPLAIQVLGQSRNLPGRRAQSEHPPPENSLAGRARFRAARERQRQEPVSAHERAYLRRLARPVQAL